MTKNDLTFRAITVVVLTCFLAVMVPLQVTFGQTSPCPYDRANPTLESARISFKSLNYSCAEKEIEDFLKLDKITIEQRANAHVLMAAVYYAKVKDEGEKRNRVIEQFKQAFRAYRDWKGELDISSTEFIEMMNAAQAQVDREMQEAEKPPEPEEEKEEKAPVVTPAEEPTIAAKEGKAWYSQWWAIALGVGLVAGAVVMVAGGGGDGDGGADETLPGFPGTPDSTKKNK